MDSQHIYQIFPSREELLSDSYEWTDEENEIAGNHFAYLKKACVDGVVILAGRSLDGVGPAIVILDIPGEKEARAFMNNDPFIKTGLMKANLHPYRAALIRD